MIASVHQNIIQSCNHTAMQSNDHKGVEYV